MIRYLFALVLGAAASCAPAHLRQPASCSPLPDSVPPPDSAAVAALAGRYEVVSVATAPGYGGAQIRGHLTLTPVHPDSAVIERWRPGGAVRVWRPLVGRYVQVHDGRRHGHPVEVTRTGFIIGCVECMDASPTHYSIVITPWGFTGRWANFQTGIGVAVDRQGRPLPDPEGYYCARRIGA